MEIQEKLKEWMTEHSKVLLREDFHSLARECQSRDIANLERLESLLPTLQTIAAVGDPNMRKDVEIVVRTALIAIMGEACV